CELFIILIEIISDPLESTLSKYLINEAKISDTIWEDPV
ncbi:hypothetical protein scyTo_0025599, partial [Scyliorhinus torazame]|nr:hypothetical protein [Scyliorhinus torazame]